MENKSLINVVITQCLPEQEEKFNRWYNEVHIPMLLQNKGLRSVTRYKDISSKSDLPRYVAVYYFANQKAFQKFEKSPEMAACLKEMIETWGKKIDVVSRVQYELLKEW